MMVRFALAILAILAASTVHAQTQRPLSDLPLVAANSLSPQEHVIFTVPLTDEALFDEAAEALAEEYGVALSAIWPLAAVNVVCYVFEVQEGTTVDGLLAAAAQDPRIVTASEVKVFTPLSSRYADELVPQQYALSAISALEAHDVATGESVKVAMIDSGVATDHNDLAEQNITFRDFIRPKAKDVIGEPHGTAMAALIAADARNAVGMVGVAPDVEMLAFRACWVEGPEREVCNTFSLARALNVAIGADVDIINLSLGGPDDPLIALLIDAAIEKDIVVVAAHGRDGAPLFPAAYPGVFGAAAARSTAEGAIRAPGLEVLSAKPGGHYDFFTGDSVATAHVTGVAALLLSARAPDFSGSKVDYLREAFGASDGPVDACELLLNAPSSMQCQAQ